MSVNLSPFESPTMSNFADHPSLPPVPPGQTPTPLAKEAPVLEFLKNAVKSKAFKELLRVLVALAAGYAGSGCSPLSAQPPAFAVLDCQLAALEVFVPRAVAEDLVMAARAENFDYVVKQLLSLDVSPASIKALAESFDACRAPEPPDAGAEPDAAPADYLRT